MQRPLNGVIGLFLVRRLIPLLVDGILLILRGADRVVQPLTAVFQIVQRVPIADSRLLSLLIVRDRPLDRKSVV